MCLLHFDRLSTKPTDDFCRAIRDVLRCSITDLFNSRHLDILVVVQRCIGCAHVVAETSHCHLITVVQCHRYSNCSQSWNVLQEKTKCRVSDSLFISKTD